MMKERSMNDEHLTADTAARLKSRMLPPAQIERAVRHAAHCVTCGATLRSADVAQLRSAFVDEDALRHLSFEELSAIVDGEATGEQQTHLDSCEICRGELEDLRLLAKPAPRRNVWWLAAAAAVVLFALIAVFALRREPTPEMPQVVDTIPIADPQPQTQPDPRAPQKPQRVMRSEWQKLVDNTLASGRLPLPAFLSTLGGPSQTLRGEGPDVASRRLEPSGIVIDTTRPELRWPRVENASYVASIFDGETMVLQSAPLAADRWRVPRPLRRGTTFTWQVEATQGGTITVLPAPPDPPARFHVISANAHRELEQARAEHPDDHLLLAVLLARAGLEREAREHLGRLSSDDPRVQRLKR